MLNLETSSDYCERAVGVQGRLEDSQERLVDRRKVCTVSGRLVTLSTSPGKGHPKLTTKTNKEKQPDGPLRGGGGRRAKTNRSRGNDWNGHRQRFTDHENMQVWVGEGDHFQRLKNPPGKEKV